MAGLPFLKFFILLFAVHGAEPWSITLPRREGGRGQSVDSAFCVGLPGFMIIPLSSTSGKKQERSSGAGHFAAVPAGSRQRPAAVQEPSGQPAHEPLSLSQPQGNHSLSGCLLYKRRLGIDGIK